MKHVNVSAIKAFSAHPFRSMKEFFARHKGGNESLEAPAKKVRYGAIFSRTALALVALEAVMLMVPALNAIAGKPPPIYKNTSLFSYFLMTPTEGMDGKPTNFWVKEGGATYQLPLSLSFGPVDTVKSQHGEPAISSRGKVSIAFMGLGGVTRADGLPMAETDFWKACVTPTVSYGNYSLSLGARWIQAKSFDVSFPAGRRTITIPGETFVDWDFGARGEWKLPRGEPGTLRSVKVDATKFNANSTIRDAYYVYSTSVGLQDGWGFDAQKETKTGNISVGASKEWGWSRGTYAAFTGTGYEFGANSIYVYAGGKIGPVVPMVAYQTEAGEKSYHFLLAIDPIGAYSTIFGSGQ